MAKGRKSKVNIPILAACILLCLTIFSVHLTSGLYARYTTTGTGQDEARVAKFDISEDFAGFSETLILGVSPGTTTKEINIKNSSEVAVRCTLEVENTTLNIPFLFSVGSSEPTAGGCSVSHELAPNEEVTLSLNAHWAQDGALQYMGMVDLVKLSLSVEQID